MRVYEIFESISGEIAGFPQGSRAIFIRLAGCNLYCSFCDAPMARRFSHGRPMTIDKIIHQIYYTGCPDKVVITGGEPLMHDDIEDLVNALCTRGFSVSIETNGSINKQISNANLIVDYKLDEPERSAMNSVLFESLTEKDVVKFVVDESTLEKALGIHKALCTCYKEWQEPIFAYSPMIPDKLTNIQQLDIMSTMSHLIMEGLHTNCLQGLVNLQLHKLLHFE